MAQPDGIDDTAPATRRSFCRFCHAACPVDVHIEEHDSRERAVKITGVPSDPLFRGYTCIKGRQLHHQQHDPQRLRTAMVRGPGGNFEETTSAEALDNIADKLQQIIDEHGPRAVASYVGTAAQQNGPSVATAAAFHRAIGSVSLYSSITIDSPMKVTVPQRLGRWEAGLQRFDQADVLLAIGYNPMVSSFGPTGGFQGTDPFQTLRDRKAEGMKLIVVDPRRTELAAQADLHLQVRPGEDPTLLAALLRIILSEGLHDTEFCDAWVAPGHLDTMIDAVEPFTPGYAADRCGVEADDIVAAAHLFAAGPTGTAGTGTGPSMAPRSSLMEHLTQCLNVVCGRYLRPGEQMATGGLLTPATPRRAQVTGPIGDPSGPESRFRGLRGYMGELPTTVLAQEIITPGPEKVRALIVVGGNPIAAFPDQPKAIEAMESLDLLVVLDHRITQTADFAHYILPPRLQLERADVPPLMDRWFNAPYASYTEAVLAPESEDVMNDWELYWELAERLGVEIRLAGGPIPGRAPDGGRPSDDDVLDLVFAKSRVPLDDVRAKAGSLTPEYAITVDEPDPHAEGRFHIALADHMVELAEISTETTSVEVIRGFDPDVHTYRLISRRVKSRVNSLGAEIPALQNKTTTNHAYMHPDDLVDLGVADDDLVRIASPYAEILGVVRATPEVRRGVISMSHSFGSSTGTDEKVRDIGAPTGRLTDVDTGSCPITGQAVQSSIPVSVAAVD